MVGEGRGVEEGFEGEMEAVVPVVVGIGGDVDALFEGEALVSYGIDGKPVLEIEDA